MIRTFLIVSQSGLVLYSKAVLRPVEQPRLVGSLLTAVMEFVTRQTRRNISQVQFDDMLLTLVTAKRARITAALFQDLSDSCQLGRLVATKLLDDFLTMFEDVLLSGLTTDGQGFSRSATYGRSYTSDDSLSAHAASPLTDGDAPGHPSQHMRNASEVSGGSPIPRSAPELVHHVIDSELRAAAPSLGFTASPRGAVTMPSLVPGISGRKPPFSSRSLVQNVTLLDRFRQFDGAFSDAIQKSALAVVAEFTRLRNVKRAILLRGNKVIASNATVDQVALLANVQFLIDDTEQILMVQGDEMRDLLFESESGLVLIRRLYVGESEDDETTDTSSIGGLYSVASMDSTTQNSALILLIFAQPEIEASEWEKVEELAKLIEDVASLHANLRIAS
ncbi:hypothetical protein CYME_CMT615C [Cyanidioschyzon merolae strain 10D]|jgi:hypothetical protein|uniref:Uncharacterized protein n=1 Tax=Cyanidioschyzon merolae (strain NIES-3377 / 10D) TaxID=280699 RepID=M1VD26_CYAM1|nr:hypothetical protein CYME_CMT615C [Cyanidioschyzon merolae strain 10D]BAM83514.1 hypothetical protein CYME_CMT615C [Cyanidioschyzon merolae strain 10D]|eukprot:XP_005539550.1 hypothetical protein CYME_CMT615C [Cyanidioschyzon merolae strain 10D]